MNASTDHVAQDDAKGSNMQSLPETRFGDVQSADASTTVAPWNRPAESRS